MQPTKVGVSSRLQLKSSQSICKAFGVESSGAKLTCSLQSDLKDFAHKCTDAAKIAGFALATSALVVSVGFYSPSYHHHHHPNSTYSSTYNIILIVNYNREQALKEALKG